VTVTEFVRMYSCKISHWRRPECRPKHVRKNCE